MAIYNRGTEKKEYREPVREHKEPIKEQVKFANVDIDLHDEITNNIKKLKTQVDFDHFRDVLRNILRSNEISSEDFEAYVSKAKQRISAISKRESQKQNAEAEESKFNETNANYDSGYKSNERDDLHELDKKLDERKVRGEDIEEEIKPESKSKLSKFRRALNFMRSPIARVGLFIILGLFLIFYLTKGSMSDIAESPLIIILAILFIILVLGRGGKTRSTEQSSNWF